MEWVDPKALSVAVVLAAVVGLFLYNRIQTTTSCDKQIAALEKQIEKIDSAHLKTIAAYELRIVELTKDRDDYKGMVRVTLEGLNKTLDVKGVPGKERL